MRKESISSGLSRSGAVVAIASAATSLLSILFVGFVGRSIDHTQYADFGAAVAIGSLLAQLLIPLTLYAARQAAALTASGEEHKLPSLEKSIRRPLMAASLIASPAIALAIWLLTPFFHFQSWISLTLAAVMTLTLSTMNIARGVLRGAHQFTRYSTSIVSEAIARVVIGIIAIHFLQPANVGIGAYVVAGASTIFVLHRLPVAESSTRVPTLRALSPLFLLTGSVALSQYMDVLAAKHYLSAIEASNYSAAATLARAATIILLPIEALLVPAVALRSDKRDELQLVLKKLAGSATLLAALPILFLVVFRHRLVALIFGASFSTAASVLIPLCSAALLSMLVYLIGQVLTAIDQSRFLIVTCAVVAGEIALLTLFHRSAQEIAMVSFSAQLLSFALHGVIATVVLRRRRIETSTP